MRTVKGDLVEMGKQGYFDVIVQGCNCFCTMGAGIAKQIKKEFPEAYAVDKTTKKGCKDKLGEFTSVYLPEYNLTVVNAYTQYKYGGKGVKVDYEALRKAFRKIKRNFSGKKIAFPKIGSGLAGGDWNKIRRIIEEEMKGERIYLVEYEPNPKKWTRMVRISTKPETLKSKKNDMFVFYSKSPDKTPGKYNGKDWSEHVDEVRPYKNLIKHRDWRKKLSNMWVEPFKLGGKTWNSVEHFFHAAKFIDNYPKFAATFEKDGGKSWSTDPFKAKRAGKAGKVSAKGAVYKGSGDVKPPTNVKMRKDFYTNNIDWKAMTLALFAKFAQNKELKDMLLATKDAELYHLVTQRGQKSKLQKWDHLMRIRHCIKRYDGKYDLAKISNFPLKTIKKMLK